MDWVRTRTIVRVRLVREVFWYIPPYFSLRAPPPWGMPVMFLGVHVDSTRVFSWFVAKVQGYGGGGLADLVYYFSTVVLLDDDWQDEGRRGQLTI